MVLFAHGGRHLIHDPAVDADELVFALLGELSEGFVVVSEVVELVPEDAKGEF